MDISERHLEPKPERPSAAALAALDGGGKLVLLPDQIEDDLRSRSVSQSEAPVSGGGRSR